MSADDAPRGPLDSSVEGVLGDIAQELGFDHEGGDGAPLSEMAESLRPPPMEEGDIDSVLDELSAEAPPTAADDMIEAFVSERPPGSAPPPRPSGPEGPTSSARAEALINAYLTDQPAPPLPKDDDEGPKLLSKQTAPADDLLESYLKKEEDERVSDPPALAHAIVKSDFPPPIDDDFSEEPSHEPLAMPSSWSRPGLAEPPSTRRPFEDEPVEPRSYVEPDHGEKPSRPPPKRSTPPPRPQQKVTMPLLVAGAVGVGLAVGLALKLSSGGETSAPTDTTNAPATTATSAPATTSEAIAETPSAQADDGKRKLIIDVKPKNAFVMFAEDGVPGGKKYAGPWPRHIDVPPGKYQLVIFLNGFKTVQTALNVEAGKDAQAVRIQLQPDDIYE